MGASTWPYLLVRPVTRDYGVGVREMWTVVLGVARRVWRVLSAYSTRDLSPNERIRVGVFYLVCGLAFCAVMLWQGFRGDWFAWGPVVLGLAYSTWFVVSGIKGRASRDEDGPTA